MEVLSDYGLEQLVMSPTRNDNTLDLILTTQPDLISNLAVVPGMSDHKAIIFDLSISFSQPKNPVRKIFLYHKCDVTMVKNDLLSFQQDFLSSPPLLKITG